VISHSHKFIFFHGYKTAGTGIKRTLDDIVDKDQFWSPNKQHLPAQKHLEFYGDSIFDNYLKFSVVRNPWDRLVSAYFYLKSRNLVETKNQFVKKNIQFCQENSFTDYVNYKNKPKPLADILCIDGKLTTDFIIRLESLQDGFDEFCDKIGIPHRNLSKMNHNTSRPATHYSVHYTPEAVKSVKQFYKKDLSLFPYTFDKLK